MHSNMITELGKVKLVKMKKYTEYVKETYYEQINEKHFYRSSFSQLTHE